MTNLEFDSILWQTRFEEGDRETFAQLYFCYYSKLLGFAFSLLGCKADAEDIVEDVFVAVWQNRSTIDSHQSLRIYLFMSARNFCLSAIRNRQAVEAGERVYTFISNEEVKIISESFLREELASGADAEINKLPFEEREVLGKVFFQNKRLETIAEDKMISIAAVQDLISRGLLRLRNNVNPENLPYRKLKKWKGINLNGH